MAFDFGRSRSKEYVTSGRRAIVRPKVAGVICIPSPWRQRASVAVVYQGRLKMWRIYPADWLLGICWGGLHGA